jgi:hypothetical protein
MTTSDVLINIACSFTSSVIFIHLLLIIYRPRIKLSPFICSQIDNFDKIGNRCYLFKMRNTSSFKAFDVTVQLYEVISLPADDGKRLDRYKLLTLKTNNFTYISRKKWAFLHPKYSDNELIFRSYEDLKTVINDDFKKIVIEVTLKHGLSGITNVIAKEFVNSHCIKDGKFRVGKKLDVI